MKNLYQLSFLLIIALFSCSKEENNPAARKLTNQENYVTLERFWDNDVAFVRLNLDTDFDTTKYKLIYNLEDKVTDIKGSKEFKYSSLMGDNHLRYMLFGNSKEKTDTLSIWFNFIEKSTGIDKTNELGKTLTAKVLGYKIEKGDTLETWTKIHEQTCKCDLKVNYIIK